VKHAVKSSASVVAFGDGLITACEGETANFVVNSKGQRGDLEIQVTGILNSPQFQPILYLLWNRTRSTKKIYDTINVNKIR